MKKLFFLFVVMLTCMNVSSFGQTRRDEITVDGFIGSEPLKSNQTVYVDYPEKWMKGIPEDAYKGETRKSFLDRIKKQSEEAKKSLIAEKKLEKERIALLVQPYQATYHKPYASNLKTKKEHKTFEEFSDSVMMDDGKDKQIDSQSQLTASSDETKKGESMTQTRAQIILLFIFCLVMMFFLFSKVPLLWRRKK